MRPSRFEQLLSARLDGSITAAEQEQLDMHLATCMSCRELWHELQRINRKMASGPMLAPSTRLEYRLERSIEALPVLSGTAAEGHMMRKIGIWSALLVPPLALYTSILTVLSTLGWHSMSWGMALVQWIPRIVSFAFRNRPWQAPPEPIWERLSLVAHLPAASSVWQAVFLSYLLILLCLGIASVFLLRRISLLPARHQS